MRPLSAAELLQVWERGWAQTPAQRALALLSAACPETPPETLAQLSVGQRDAHLLTLREWTFGPRLTGLVVCPGCRARLEVTFSVPEVRAEPEAAPPETLAVTTGGYAVLFRLPGSLDLDQVAGGEDVAGVRLRLLQGCVLGATREGLQVGAERLPVEVIEAVIAEMARADPQAEVELRLSCSSCGHHWPALFDIATFFWGELEAWGLRLLREVHALASAYGWREADILAISPWRRQIYLGMVGG